MTASQIITALQGFGMTKWAIKKKLGVHWNTLNNWHRGIFQPTPESKQKLEELYLSKKQRGKR